MAPSPISDAQKSTWAATLCGPDPVASQVGISVIATGCSVSRPSITPYWTSTCSDRSIVAMSETSSGRSALTRMRTGVREVADERSRSCESLAAACGRSPRHTSLVSRPSRFKPRDDMAEAIRKDWRHFREKVVAEGVEDPR
jgi:hypothetical protein